MKKVYFKDLNVVDADKYSQSIKDLLVQVYLSNFDDIENLDSLIDLKFIELRNYLKCNQANLTGAIDNDKLVAFLWSFVREVNNISILHINQLVVDESYRSQGIGHELIKQVELLAKNNNITKIDLLASTSNTNAIAFYNSNDFEITRVVLEKRLY